MTNKAKIKGDKAEREAAALLSELLGIRVERRFGAGQKLDTGDLDANEVAELFGKSSGYKAADPNVVPDTAPSSVEDDEDF